MSLLWIDNAQRDHPYRPPNESKHYFLSWSSSRITLLPVGFHQLATRDANQMPLDSTPTSVPNSV